MKSTQRLHDLGQSPWLDNITRVRSIKEATELHGRAKRPNLFIKVPGTREGLPAIEETVFTDVPVNANSPASSVSRFTTALRPRSRKRRWKDSHRKSFESQIWQVKRFRLCLPVRRAMALLSEE